MCITSHCTNVVDFFAKAKQEVRRDLKTIDTLLRLAKIRPRREARKLEDADEIHKHRMASEALLEGYGVITVF